MHSSTPPPAGQSADVPTRVDAPEIAAMRRELVAEALDGAIFQANGAIRFLERGDDACAEKAMARMFDFARQAAVEMKQLTRPEASAA